jgi:hypothetical protein
MKFAEATKFHRKSGEGLGNRIQDDPSAVGAALERACVIRSSLTCLRQVSPGMNNVSELVITAITPNGSAPLPFVIPSEAEGSAVPLPSIKCLGGNRFVQQFPFTTELPSRAPQLAFGQVEGENDTWLPLSARQ